MIPQAYLTGWEVKGMNDEWYMVIYKLKTDSYDQSTINSADVEWSYHVKSTYEDHYQSGSGISNNFDSDQC